MNRQIEYSRTATATQAAKGNNLVNSKPGARREVLSASDLQARYHTQLKQLLATARRLCNARVIVALTGLMQRRGMF
jgi:hypothetical protein